MIEIDNTLKPENLKEKLANFWRLSGEKIKILEERYDSRQGSPVFTVNGAYTSRGWTEWTQGFQFGSALIQFDACADEQFLNIGREHTVEMMAPHLSHTGVHDHGFNNVSTYGNLLRLMKEGKIPQDPWEKNFYELALKISGAVQAGRWTVIKDGGFIYSFNGPHSLFVDTIRSCRALLLSDRLGQVLMAEGDRRINLLERAVEHIRATAAYSIYYGDGRDACDVWGRTAHESVFNQVNGAYRCPNSQQGFSGLTTWTRGLAWAMCGFSELLEFIKTIDKQELEPFGGREEMEALLLKAARATCDFYIANSPTDGIPYWDTGAPNLVKLGDYLACPAEPYNEYEPVDSSAACIGAQGLLRTGHYLEKKGEKDGKQYWQAGLTVLNSLLDAPYLSEDPEHQGLILHSIYHRPNGWDHVPEGAKIPCGESSMWGDYHAREAALYLQKILKDEPYLTFFGGL